MELARWRAQCLRSATQKCFVKKTLSLGLNINCILIGPKVLLIHFWQRAHHVAYVYVIFWGIFGCLHPLPEVTSFLRPRLLWNRPLSIHKLLYFDRRGSKCNFYQVVLVVHRLFRWESIRNEGTPSQNKSNMAAICRVSFRNLMVCSSKSTRPVTTKLGIYLLRAPQTIPIYFLELRGAVEARKFAKTATYTYLQNLGSCIFFMTGLAKIKLKTYFYT